MFGAKDKNGQQIFLRDTVSYEAQVDSMGLLGTAEGEVLTIPSENMVQVQPLNGGAPEIMEADLLTVTYSLIAEVANLKTNEELQELVLKAELRYGTAVTASKSKRGGKRTKAAPKDNPFTKAAENPFAGGAIPKQQNFMLDKKDEGEML